MIQERTRPMKKTSFVIAILVSALLAAACGKKKEPAAPMNPPPAGDMGSAAGSGGWVASLRAAIGPLRRTPLAGRVETRSAGHEPAFCVARCYAGRRSAGVEKW